MSDLTPGEVKLMFLHIQKALDDLKEIGKERHLEYEKRFSDIDAKIAGLNAFQNRAMTLWGLVVFVVTLVASKIINTLL